MAATPKDILYQYEYTELVWSSGVFIGTLFTGGLIVLGITCLVLLSSSNSGPPTQRRVLQIFIFVLSLATIGLELSYFFSAHSIGLFQPANAEQLGKDISQKLVFGIDLLPVIVLCMTDGLLVWRCYMVQRAIGESAKWQNIFWILPGCLWILNWVMGVWGMVDGLEINSLLIQGLGLVSNVLLNVHATLYIFLRLFLHRRMVLKNFGDQAPPARYMHIISILLQSAAINIPIAITAAVGIMLDKDWGLAVTPATCAGQAFASVLVIHQVSISRTLDSQERGPQKERLLGSGGLNSNV